MAGRVLWGDMVGGPLDGRRFRYPNSIPRVVTFQACVEGRWHSDDYVREPNGDERRSRVTVFRWSRHDCPRMMGA